ncbi:hypothetical protein T484DRAFT_1754360 [Baffinella frigidus]|nr:hypothetical protein T484DRAFT_1754360 [Cryptophyta sp. CCMP2293]
MDAGPIHDQSVGSGDASQLSWSVEVIETRAGSVEVIETLAGNMTVALLDFILRVGQRKNDPIVASQSVLLGQLYHLMNEHHRDARQRHVAKQWQGTCVQNPSRVGFCRNQHLVVVLSNRQEMKRFLDHIQSQEFISKLGDGWTNETMSSSKIVAFSLVPEDSFASIGDASIGDPSTFASIGVPFTFAPEATCNIGDSWGGDIREAASPGKRLASAEPPKMPHAPTKIGRFEMGEEVGGRNLQPMLDELLLFGVNPPPPPPPAASEQGGWSTNPSIFTSSMGLLEAHQPFVEPPSPVATTELVGSKYPALPRFGTGSYARSVETDLDGASVMDTDGVHPNTNDVDGPLVMMLQLSQRANGKPFQGLVGRYAFGVSPTPGKTAASVVRALTQWGIHPTNAQPCNSCEVAFGAVKTRVTSAFIGNMEM